MTKPAFPKCDGLTPLEKVARAICGELFGPYDADELDEHSVSGQSRLAARAALSALREPSGAMKDAGARSFGVGNGYIGPGAELLDGQPSKCWRAMIDEALGEEG